MPVARLGSVSDAAFPWSPGAATGVGSLPGDDIGEAMRLVMGELPDLPHLPELPARGPGADLVGRGASLLVDLHVDLQPAGWRLVSRPGVDERRARDLLARDLDTAEALAGAHDGPFKVQIAGPWTLAASLELTRGGRVLSDQGAVRDVVASLVDGVRGHLADVRRRLPRAALVLQVDEPALPAVLAGRVPTASGFGALSAVETPTAAAALRDVLAVADEADAVPVVHCCAAAPPLTVLADAGARGVSVDATRLSARDDDAVGVLVERGVALFLGLVPGLGPGVAPKPADVVAPARQLWRRLGFDPQRLPESVVVTPACGLGTASEGWARTAMRLVRQAGRILAEAPEGMRT